MGKAYLEDKEEKRAEREEEGREKDEEKGGKEGEIGEKSKKGGNQERKGTLAPPILRTYVHLMCRWKGAGRAPLPFDT